MRVLGRQLHQLFFGSLLRHAQIDPAAFTAAQPLFQDLDVRDLLLQHQFPRNIGRARIKLLHKIQQDLRRVIPLHMGHIEMLPADQLAVPHEKDLHHGVRLILGQRQNILVLAVAVRDLLLLRHALDTVVEIPVPYGILELQILGRLRHLFLQILQKRLIVAVQEIQRLFHAFSVRLPVDIALTGSQTLLDMVIQAGPLEADIPRQPAVAGL